MKIPLRLPIKVGKTYYTRDGHEVQIYATDRGGIYPIHGAILGDDNIWNIQRWKTNGEAFFDIINNITRQEQKLDDKELVWCWDDDMTYGKYLGFYDAKYNLAFFSTNGKRGGNSFDHYAPYEGGWPQWAKDAHKNLEN